MNKTNSVCHKRGSSGRRKTKELLGRLTYKTKHSKNIRTLSPDDVFNATYLLRYGKTLHIRT